MFEALLRLKTWHMASIHMVIPDERQDAWRGALQEWEEAVGVARVWSASQWAPELGVIWRGSIHVKVIGLRT